MLKNQNFIPYKEAFSTKVAKLDGVKAERFLCSGKRRNGCANRTKSFIFFPECGILKAYVPECSMRRSRCITGGCYFLRDLMLIGV